MKRFAILVAALLVAGCGGEVTATPEPKERPTTAPTPVPWALDVTDTAYTKEATVGDNITVEVTIENTGKQRNPVTKLNFSELDQYADLFGCDPDCETEDLPGLGPTAILPGVQAGESVTYTVEFIATTVGVVEWSLCLYGEDSYSEDGWCGEAKTAIR